MSNDFALSSKASMLSQVFGLLALTLIPTIIGGYVGMVNHIFAYGWGASLAMFFVLMGVFFIIPRVSKPIGVGLLFVVTFIMGLMGSGMISLALSMQNGGQLIATAGSITVGTFAIMSLIGATTKKDLSGLGGFLFVGLIIVILAGIVNIFLQLPILYLVGSAVGAILFSLYILYDINRAVNSQGNDPVMITLALYLDIYNLFMNLLNILMILSGNKRD